MIPLCLLFPNECGQTGEVPWCPSCGAENPPTAKFCLECAKPLGKSESESPEVVRSTASRIHLSDRSVEVALEGERKTVTALFADIKGSTELIRDLRTSFS